MEYINTGNYVQMPLIIRVTAFPDLESGNV